MDNAEGILAAPTVASVLNEAIQELNTDAPPKSEEFASEEDSSPERKRPRIRKGENVKPTALQHRYTRQVRNRKAANYTLVDQMSKLVAWTWLPGRDRATCPPIVDLRSPRLLTMDRFPDSEGAPCTRIGITMHRCNISRNNRVGYACADNIEMFKDFSLMPKFKAGGLALDSRNEEVFRTALELDYHMEMVAQGKVEPVNSFDPPQVLVGFPVHYLPTPEWKAPMQDAVRAVLQPDAPTLKCLLSPGGLVVDVVDTNDGFKAVNIESQGNLILVKMPNWAVLAQNVRKQAVVAKGQPLAELPRSTFNNMKEITGRYPFKSLEWLERRLLDEMTEMVTVEEEVFNKQTGQRTAQDMTWRCVPSQFVQTQMGRAVRFFMDFRRHLGRRIHKQDAFERDSWSENPNQARIDVMQFPTRPTVKDLQFADGPVEKDATWVADLMSQGPDVPWAGRLGLRGVTDAHSYTVS
jgi:hypothetical protein